MKKEFNVYTTILNNVNKLEINKEENILLALSGGVDSVVLYDVLTKSGYTVVPIYFNHKLRKESDEEEKNLVKYYDNLIVGTWESPRKDEESARNARYDFFRNTMNELGENKLFVGHHMDDNNELFLMRLFKGSQLTSLSGMNLSSNSTLLGKDKEVTRPMLGVSKDDIYTYARENGLVWYEDNTNKGIKYTRNFIRNKVMPLLKEKFTNKVCKHLNDTQNDIRDMVEILDDVVYGKIIHGRRELPLINDRVVLESETLQTNNKLLNREILKYVLNGFLASKQVSREVMDTLLGFVNESVPGDKYLITEGNYLFKDIVNDEEVVFILTSEEILGDLEYDGTKYTKYESKKSKVGNKRLKKVYQELKYPFYLRNCNLLENECVQRYEC